MFVDNKIVTVFRFTSLKAFIDKTISQFLQAKNRKLNPRSKMKQAASVGRLSSVAPRVVPFPGPDPRLAGIIPKDSNNSPFQGDAK
jgi:hypothetical protein